MNSTVKQLLIWVLLFAGVICLWMVVGKNMGGAKELTPSYSEVMSKAKAGQIKDVTIDGTTLSGHYQNNDAFHTTIGAAGQDPTMMPTFLDHGVNVTNKDQNSNFWVNTLISIAPFALLLGLWFFLLRQMQSGGNKAMSFGKSRARLLSMQQKKITFKDVAGVDEAKEELKEIIEFLREAQKFQRLGGRIPKGVLLVGPP